MGGEAEELPGVQIDALDGRLIGLAVPRPDDLDEPTEYEVAIPPLPSSSDPAASFEDSMRFMVLNCRATGGYCDAAGMESWEASPPAN